MEQKNSTKNVAFNTLAVIGLVVVLSIATWAGIRTLAYVPNAMSSLAAAFVNIRSVFIPAERIEVTTNTSTLASGNTFNLSWNHIGKSTDGSYKLSYPCADGVHLETVAATGVRTPLFCNTPSNFLSTNNTVSLIAFSTKTNTVDLPIRIDFQPNGSTETTRSGEATITVTKVASSGNTTGTNSGSGTTAGTPTNTIIQFGTTTGTVTHTSDPLGRPDLQTIITATGLIDPVTNEFIASSTVRSVDRAAVKFTVQNVGTKETGQWYFTAVLPTDPFYIYDSKSQPSLFPGDRIEYVLGFDSIKGLGDNLVIVNADPIDSVRNELSDTNNIAKVNIKVVPLNY